MRSPKLCRIFGCLLRRPRHVLASLFLCCLLMSYGGFPSTFKGYCQSPSTEEASAGEFQPRLGTFSYVIQWGPKKVADATLTVERDGDFFRMVADQKTTPFIDRIYRIKYSGETMIRADGLVPTKTTLKGDFRKSQRVDEVEYKEDGKAEAVVTKTKRRSPPQKQVYEIESETFALDIFSSVFLARSFDWQEGESQHFETFTGDKHYEITIDCIGKTLFEEGKIKATAWVLRPSARDFDDPNAEPKYNETRVYLTADRSRDLLKIRSKLGFGTMQMKLIEYVPEN